MIACLTKWLSGTALQLDTQQYPREQNLTQRIPAIQSLTNKCNNMMHAHDMARCMCVGLMQLKPEGFELI